jgi:hypothetical protein
MTTRSLEEALRYISAELRENPSTPIAQLIEKTCKKFDLSPIQGEQLLQKYLSAK